MTAEEINAKVAEIERQKALQHKKEFYKKNRERLLEKMKEYNKSNRKEQTERERAYKNFDRVQYCRMMIKRWERKLKEAEAEE